MRRCNNPTPSPGGKQCIGNPIRAAGKIQCLIYGIPFSAGYLNVYIELFLFELDCVTDRYPKGLRQNCRRQFSCDVLKRLNRCNKQYKNAMSLGCKTQITNWWKNQWVKNNCKKACLNCAPRKWAMLCYRSYISF